MSIYLFAIGIAGCALVVLMPPMVGSDEAQHWFRALQIADGTLLAPKYGDNNWGGLISSNARDLAAWFNEIFQAKDPIPISDLQQLLETFPAHVKEKVTVSFSSTAAFSPLAYLPCVAGIVIAKLMGFDLLHQFWAARLGNFGVYLAGVAAVVAITPRAQATVLAVCTMPTLLHVASSLSSDPINILAPALLAALCLRLRLCHDVAPRAWIPALAIITIAHGLLKPTHIVFVGLTLLIPAERFGSSRRKTLMLLGLAGATFVVAATWSAKYPFVPGTYWKTGADPSAAIAALLSDIPGASQSFFSNLWNRAALWWMDGYARFGGHASPYSLLVMPTIGWIALSQMVALTIAVGGPRFDPRGALILLSLGVVSATSIVIAFWIGYTPPDSPIILGIQGRYFAPSVLLCFLAVSSATTRTRELIWLRTPLLFAVLACHLASVVVALIYFQAVWPASALEAARSSRPSNDLFARPAQIGFGQLSAGTNVGAFKELDEPIHAGNAGGHSIWWSFTAPVSGRVTLDTAGSNFDTLLAVYTGDTLGMLTEIVSNDDLGPVKEGGIARTSRLSFDVVAGTTYRIAVDGHHGETGRVLLRLSELPGATAVRAAVAPARLTARVTQPALVYATILNVGKVDATGCFIEFAEGSIATANFQTTDPNTNLPIGNPNTAADIAAGHLATFVINITIGEPFEGDLAPTFRCANASAAELTPGVNTIHITTKLPLE